MGISEIIALVSGIVKFLPEVRKLIEVLSKSPAQKAAEITEALSKESERLRTEGRPTWGK